MKITLGQKVSFGLGRVPVDEVHAAGFNVRFEEDKSVPQFDNEGNEKPPKIIEGRAILSWNVGERWPPDHAHPIEVKLDAEKTAWLRGLIENKTQAELAVASRTARGE